MGESQSIELADNPNAKGKSFELSDQDLVKRIQRREQEYSQGLTDILERAKKNRAYYRGDQVREDDLYEDEIGVVVNKIFQGMETLIPIATKKTPDPNVIIRPITAQNNRLKRKLYQKLREEWEVEQQMPIKMQSALRNLKTAFHAVFKYYWDDETNEMCFKLMPIGSVIFPKDCATAYECPAIIEYVDSTLGELMEKYPDHREQLKRDAGEGATEDSKMRYIEYHENEFYACKYKETILFRGDNPNFSKVTDENGNTFNHFKRPEKPYIFLNHITFGDSMVDETSEIEQAISLQDTVNKRKRQISNAAGSGKTVVAGGKMARADFNEISNDPDEKIYLEDQDDVTGAIMNLPPKPLSEAVYSDMMDSKAEIDNTMGTHATTRGERDGQETASGRVLLKESDVDRIGLLATRIENFSYYIFRAMLQMMYVFYDEQMPVHFYDNENDLKALSPKEEEVYIINTEFYNKFIRILVKNGSTLPEDTFAKKAEAVDLAKNGMMSWLDMYRILDYENPEQLARNAYLQQTNPAMLYEQLGDDGFQIDAIQHMKQITESEVMDSDLFDIFDTPDITLYEKHLTTQLEYIKGTEIDPELIPYDSLDFETKRIIREHIMMEKTQFDQLVAEEQERLARMQQTNGIDLPPELMAILEQLQGGAVPTEEPPIPVSEGGQGNLPPIPVV